MSQQRWETRPLECWTKAKEIRRDYEQAPKKAKEQKELLVQGRDLAMFALPGLRSVTDNPMGAMIAAQGGDAFSRECRAACEVRGLGRDICGYFRNTFGSMYLNRDLRGGEFPCRDLSVGNSGGCDCHTKQLQPVAEHFGGPMFSVDYVSPVGGSTKQRVEARLEYVTGQLLDQIEFLEKVTGKKFDDEKFATVVKDLFKIEALAREVILLNRNTPAPLDQKSFHSFMTLGIRTRTNQADTEAFWTELRDETQWRVEHKIAAVATERYRWLEDQPPPWYYLKYYRYLEKYGTVCIGSPYTHAIGGLYEIAEDGAYRLAQNPVEMGWPLDTREDIVRAIEYGSIMGFNARQPSTHEKYAKLVIDMAKDFKVDGAILPLARAGVGCVHGIQEVAVQLVDAGISTMCYEYSQPGDRTDFDEARFLEQIDNFMESQGLRKLED